MKPKYIMWGAIAIGVALLAVLVLRPAGGGGIENVDSAGAQQAIDAGAQTIDVRTAGEFQMGHIPGAINTPVDQLEAAAQTWDREATYLVYCATGDRSVTAVETMKALGFVNIKHFAEGIQAWTGELDQGGASSATTIPTAGLPVMIEFFTDS